ncbi:haloacid dehalogenase type II [Mesorhizobium sp. ZMM04-5]|uniref:(S)-2-haloacid dehalogenase n=1 Tax=Mesorhizobium marinum TaxID=3228790 RepID=A0ABV3R0J2_9HYPH
MTHSAYVFDAYGTLFDVHSAVGRHAGAVGPQAATLSEIWRTKQLEYSWVRTLMGAYADFRQLTEQALDFALEKVPSVDRRLRNDLLAAYSSLDCYAEVPGVLRELKASGAKVAILSNGSPAMLQAAIVSASLDHVFDAVFSVDAIGRFKTDPATYRLVTSAWRLEPSAVSFQSSNRWDIAGATSFGFRTVWINRTGQPDEYPDLPPSLTLPNLDGLLAGA